jgi:hypothetical protein
MCPTRRKGTAAVCHPVVLSAFGSSRRYEAAIEYTNLRNRYRMAALTAHDRKLLKLHLRRAQQSSSAHPGISSEVEGVTPYRSAYGSAISTSASSRFSTFTPPMIFSLSIGI